MKRLLEHCGLMGMHLVGAGTRYPWAVRDDGSIEDRSVLPVTRHPFVILFRERGSPMRCTAVILQPCTS